MSKIRVLVVDDSALIRKILSETLKQDPDIEVVGMASTGKTALQQIKILKPDIITLDIEMPEMSGLDALRHLRNAEKDTTPVIMFSSLTEEGAAATLEALDIGADDFVAKPTAGRIAQEDGKRLIQHELIDRIKALVPTNIKRASSPAIPAEQPPRERKISRIPKRGSKVSVVGIAISTGGPNALAELVSQLSPDISVPIVVTQHMPPYFTKMLAERLTVKGPIQAVEAEAGQMLEAGKIYIAPGNYHLEFEATTKGVFIDLTQSPPENSCRPSADVMLRSLAKVYGSSVLAVVMTGMGNDGLRGCEQIRKVGGIVLAQDEASSVVWGMPGAVVEAGLAHDVLTLRDIAPQINTMTRSDVPSSTRSSL